MKCFVHSKQVDRNLPLAGRTARAALSILRTAIFLVAAVVGCQGISREQLQSAPSPITPSPGQQAEGGQVASGLPKDSPGQTLHYIPESPPIYAPVRTAQQLNASFYGLSIAIHDAGIGHGPLLAPGVPPNTPADVAHIKQRVIELQDAGMRLADMPGIPPAHRFGAAQRILQALDQIDPDHIYRRGRLPSSSVATNNKLQTPGEVTSSEANIQEAFEAWSKQNRAKDENGNWWHRTSMGWERD
jgi:hypothetical protein